MVPVGYLKNQGGLLCKVYDFLTTAIHLDLIQNNMEYKQELNFLNSIIKHVNYKH